MENPNNGGTLAAMKSDRQSRGGIVSARTSDNGRLDGNGEMMMRSELHGNMQSRSEMSDRLIEEIGS